MENIDVVRENISFEQLFSEGDGATVLKGEYLIPDTHPDVYKVLAVDCKPYINNKEILKDKLLVEGEIQYNVMYLAKEDESLGAHSVTYNDKFSNYIDIAGLEHNMVCEAECDVEHIYATIINERKISLDGICDIIYEVYKTDSLDLVKDIESQKNVEMKKKIETFDNMVASKEINLQGTENITIGTEKPEIDSILKCIGMIHKKDVKAVDGKITCSCFVKFSVVYRGKDTKDLYTIDEDIFMNQDEEFENPYPDISVLDSFELDKADCELDSDDLGEQRIINLSAAVKAKIKIYDKTTIEILDDAYMTDEVIGIKKDDVSLASLLGDGKSETVVKDNLYLKEEDPVPVEIINVKGKAEIVDKKIEDGKVKAEGFVKVEVIYRTDSDQYLSMITGEIPFNAAIDINNIKDNSKVVVKSALESIQAAIEANTIAIKTTVTTGAKAWGEENKNCVIDVEELDEEIPQKKASITIYTVQRDDNLWVLAKKYNTTVENIAKINEIEDENYVEEGRKLIIPGRAVIS